MAFHTFSLRKNTRNTKNVQEKVICECLILSFVVWNLFVQATKNIFIPLILESLTGNARN